ncbi:hypothetical protein O0L34_g6970 [Tuta absoluta]|nr:hypothetical protein O0L34_g6970 [Tuta absoluta]
MRQYRIAIGVLVAIFCFITLLLYYYWHISSETKIHKTYRSGNDYHINVPPPKSVSFEEVGKPFKHMRLDLLYKDGNKDDTSLEVDKHKYAMFIDTPGCKIPVSMVPFTDKRKRSSSCGKRAVFLKKIGDEEVQAVIKEKIVKTYLRKSAIFECCYRFIIASKRAESRKIKYTACKKFQDGAVIPLETDFVNIKCFEQRKNTSHEVYDDVFAFAKKINVTRKPSTHCKRKYNVLLLGMDSMSLSRFSQLMERSVTFLYENYVLGYRAYHKIGDNTLPNLMAVLTGQNISTIKEKCAGNMDNCRKMFIWNKFREDGYVTAYGEDYLRLPDTFHGDYEFAKQPTHHYLSPLFVKGETELFNKSLVCAGKVPSAQHLLDYAFDFVSTYRSESFFGLFWMNSYSHNENSRPQDADNMLESFFNRLTYTGILDNTFVIFFSDHGVRFGKYRFISQSYYDERMPFLFVWTPDIFKVKYSSLFKSLAYNRNALVTPYDLYNTLIDIHRLSVCDRSPNNTEITSVAEGCPKCHSMFNTISPNRTCRDAGIDDKWCSCHNIYPLEVEDTQASKSVLLIVSYITNMSKTVKAKHCWGCLPLRLRSVLRIHFYYDDAKVNLYHVVALSMTPGNVSYEAVVLEAVVLRRGKEAELLGSVSVISPYRGLGRCTVNPKDRVFCVCQKMEHCY